MIIDIEDTMKIEKRQSSPNEFEHDDCHLDWELKAKW
jgi:hypothetical protein